VPSVRTIIIPEFVVSSERVFVDFEKVKAITKWPQPQTIRRVRSFYGLATFHRRFIKNFSAITALITNCLKNERFQWTPAATSTFKKMKKLMTEVPIMRLSDFLKVFEVTCDASGLAIGGVLSQEKHHVAHFTRS